MVVNQHHNYIVNMECVLYSTTYKQFMKKKMKLYNKYIKLNLHLKSLDRDYVPDKDTLNSKALSLAKPKNCKNQPLMELLIFSLNQ